MRGPTQARFQLGGGNALRTDHFLKLLLDVIGRSLAVHNDVLLHSRCVYLETLRAVKADYKPFTSSALETLRAVKADYKPFTSSARTLINTFRPNSISWLHVVNLLSPLRASAASQTDSIISCCRSKLICVSSQRTSRVCSTTLRLTSMQLRRRAISLVLF